MKLFGIELRKPSSDMVTVTCYGCAKAFAKSASEVRVYNYCNTCM